MELKGKKINFLGDSITEGVGVSAPDKIYLNLIRERCGLAEARNYGISGSRIARQINKSELPRARDFCERINDMDADADIVVVFGGTNDFGHGAPIGTSVDKEPNTFYGACNCLMEGLINKYPAAQIVFITPLHRENETNLRGSGKEYNVATLENYVEIIKDVAKYYAIPVLDLFSISGIQPCVPILKQKYCPDGLHPNDAGHEIIASKLVGLFKIL